MAFKMNYNRDSFPYKTDERVKDDLINIRKNERPTEQGPTKMEDGYTMKTPYEKNKYSSHMPKHGADHKMSSADEKRYDNLLNTLNKMNDPMNSNRGKSILKELKKLKPGFNPEDHTMGQ